MISLLFGRLGTSASKCANGTDPSSRALTELRVILVGADQERLARGGVLPRGGDVDPLDICCQA